MRTCSAFARAAMTAMATLATLQSRVCSPSARTCSTGHTPTRADSALLFFAWRGRTASARAGLDCGLLLGQGFHEGACQVNPRIGGMLIERRGVHPDVAGHQPAAHDHRTCACAPQRRGLRLLADARQQTAARYCDQSVAVPHEANSAEHVHLAAGG